MNTLKFPGSRFLTSLCYGDISSPRLSLRDLHVYCGSLVNSLEGAGIDSQPDPRSVGRCPTSSVLSVRLCGLLLPLEVAAALLLVDPQGWLSPVLWLSLTPCHPLQKPLPVSCGLRELQQVRACSGGEWEHRKSSSWASLVFVTWACIPHLLYTLFSWGS